MSAAANGSQLLIVGVCFFARTDDYLHVYCDASQRVVSFAAPPGDFSRATDFFNLRVDKQASMSLQGSGGDVSGR